MTDKNDVCDKLMQTYYNLMAEYNNRTEAWQRVRTECSALHSEIVRIEKLLIDAGYEHVRMDDFIKGGIK